MPNLTVAAGMSVPASGVASAYDLVDGLAGTLVAAAAGALVGDGVVAAGVHALIARVPTSPAASRTLNQCIIDKWPPFRHRCVGLATRPYVQTRHPHGECLASPSPKIHLALWAIRPNTDWSG